jgi:hypothetical protein
LHAAYLANQAVFEIPFLTTRCPDHIFAQFWHELPAGWPDWANFRPMGDRLLCAVL